MATARKVDISQEELDKAARGVQGAAYATIECPGEHVAILESVEDYESDNTKGWIWHFEINGVDFREWTAFGKKAKWRLLQVLGALDPDLEPCKETIDPDAYVGNEVGVFVNWSISDEDWDREESRYRELETFFPLADEPTEEDADDDGEDPEEV